MTNEEYPRIMYTRRPPKSAQQWGPFPNAGAAKQVMQLLRRQFGIRDCKELLPQGCLSMHIGLCAGPCIDGAGYDERVKTVRRVLNGMQHRCSKNWSLTWKRRRKRRPTRWLPSTET